MKFINTNITAQKELSDKLAKIEAIEKALTKKGVLVAADIEAEKKK